MMGWRERALELHNEGVKPTPMWKQIQEEYPEDELTLEQVRSHVRRNSGRTSGQPSTDDILKQLNKMSTLDDISERTGLSKRVILAHIDDLKEEGYEIHTENNKYWLQRNPTASANEYKADFGGERTIKIGVCSDPHTSNKFQQITHLNDFYDKCAEQGVRKVYNCGDVCDGFYKQREEQLYELFKFGVDDQAQYLIENYPYREGIDTEFILGNHDITHMNNGGANIGKMVAKERPDMKYLGIDFAKIWLTPKCDMDLVHPGGGSSYAQSYQIQKGIDAIQGGSKPQIQCTGHYHKQFYMLYRNIHAFAVPCFCAQTPFMRRNRLSAVVGGLILTIHVLKTGEIRELEHKAINYYFMKDNDY